MAFQKGLVEPDVRAHLLADESIVFAHARVAGD